MKKKRSLLALTLVLVMLFALAACNGGESPTSPSSNPTADTPSSSPAPVSPSDEDLPKSDVVLTYIVDRDTEFTGFKAVMDRFTEITGISFEEELRPGGADGETILKTRFATGDAPDFIWFNSGSLLATLDPVKNLVDLSGQPYMSKLQDSYKQTVTVDGKIFGIPGRTSMGGAWLYNRRLNDQLGLSIPTSWAELMDNCQKAKDAGVTPIAASYKDDWTAQLILLADYGNVAALSPNFAADFNTNKAKYATTPAALRSFEKLAEVKEKGFLNEDYLATTYDFATEMLVNGDALYYPMLTFALDNIAVNFPDEINNIGLFAQPADNAADTTLTVWMPDGWYACSGSSHFEEVNRFFDFYLSEEGQSVFAANQRGNGPSVVDGAVPSADDYQAVKDMKQYFDSGKTAPAMEFITAVKGPNLPQICVQVGSGLVTPVVGAGEYDKDVEKQAQQLQLSGW